MKRGDFLYPHSFLVCAVLSKMDDPATVREINRMLKDHFADHHPQRASHYASLKQLERHGYVRRVVVEGSHPRWVIEHSGVAALAHSFNLYSRFLDFVK